MHAFVNVQCKTDAGETGVFLTANAGADDRKPISPVFPSLFEFYPWAKENGWASSGYDHGSDTFHPLRMVKA